MSGTHYGTCVLHASPESAVGGPLALLQTGDMVELDVPARRIHMAVDDAELARRRAAWRKPAPRYTRGVLAKFANHSSSASFGAVLDKFE
jgi:dihydroxy-acid dehydratase